MSFGGLFDFAFYDGIQQTLYMSLTTSRSYCGLILCVLIARPIPLFAQTGALADSYKPHFLRSATAASQISIGRCQPEYPRVSLRNEESGVSTIEYKTEDTGRLFELRVLKSGGFKNLDNAVLSALQNCRFKPATINGKAVQGHSIMQYVWSLD